MRKLTKVGVLGGLVVAAFLLLVSLPVSGNGSAFVLLFRRAEQAFLRTCPQTFDPDSCRVAVRAMFLYLQGGFNDGSRFDEAMTKEVARVVQKTMPNNTCAGCLDAAHTFLDNLGQNDTVHDLTLALHGPCGERYRNETLRLSCEEHVDEFLPRAIDRLLVNATPTRVCQSLNFCP
jgi:hypothetical protein